MTSRTADYEKAGSVGSSIADETPSGLGFLSLLLLSAWCGLVAGLLEVGTIVLRKQVFDPNHLYKVEPPLRLADPARRTSACSWRWDCSDADSSWPGRAAAAGCSGASLVRAGDLARSCWSPFPGSTAWPGWSWRWGWPRGSSRSSSAMRRMLRRFVLVSFPAAVAVVAILGASVWAGRPHQAVARRVRGRCRRRGRPNVLLIVLDTVAAGHLSLHGYGRRHQHDPGRARRARDPVRFGPGGLVLDAAVPCDDVHGTMVARALGRLAHPAGPGASHAGGVPRRPGLRDGRVRRQYLVLCQPIRGWPAASLVTRISSSPSSPHSRSPSLVDRALEGFQAIVYFTEDWLESAGLLPLCPTRLAVAGQRSQGGRGGQSRVARLALATPRQPERPFFAFLNYFDAHIPISLPPGRLHRFGVEPTDNHQRDPDPALVGARQDDALARGRGVRRRRLRRLHRGPRRAAREAGRRAGPARVLRADLADHRLGPRRELRRACRRLLPRYEPLRDRAARPARSSFRRAGRDEAGRRGGRSACATWRRRSSTWPAWRPSAPFPGVSLARFWRQPAEARRLPRPHPLLRGWPRWSRTTRPIAIPGACAKQVVAAGGREGGGMVVHPP